MKKITSLFICLTMGFACIHADEVNGSPAFANPSIKAQNIGECIPDVLQNLPYAIYPDSASYNTARLNYNKRFNYFPKAIFSPTTYQEAQFVLRNLKKYHLEFAIRSGRHCFEPGSLSPYYIFDLSNFNSLVPDIDNNQVFVGAGNTNKTVIEGLGQLNYAIPTGTCPTVGVPGLTMGGGIGFLGPILGLTCDSVKSITLLNAEAEIIEVNKNSYPDLFWALRGAGNGSYGIVLGITYQMYYIPQATFYELTWEFDAKLICPIMHAFQKWAKNLPADTSAVLGVRHPNEMCADPETTPPLVMRVFGLYLGSQPFTSWKKYFERLNPEVKIFTGSYQETAKFWSFEPPLPFNKVKSRMLFRPLTNKVISMVEKFFTQLEKNDPDFLVYFNFEALGGKIREGDTAYFPRNAFGWWEQAYYWPRQDQSAEVLGLSRAFYAKIPKEVSKFCYANIVDYDLGKCYLTYYYGDHVRRLIEIKNKYDPKNLFHWRQSIPTTLHP